MSIPASTGSPDRVHFVKDPAHSQLDTVSMSWEAVEELVGKEGRDVNSMTTAIGKELPQVSEESIRSVLTEMSMGDGIIHPGDPRKYVIAQSESGDESDEEYILHKMQRLFPKVFASIGGESAVAVAPFHPGLAELDPKLAGTHFTVGYVNP